jgi:hypothetical protein
MVSILSLWAPILLSAVCVFIASSLIHMVIGWHKGDWGQVAREDDVLEAFRSLGVAPGDYAVPCATSMRMMSDPAFVAKRTKGPVVLMTVAPGGPPAMGANLLQWFLYSVLVSMVAAYVAGRAVGPGADYLAVFRFSGVTAFAAYALALPQQSIWYMRRWSSVLKTMMDGLIYALLTAGCFGWLWPR